MVLDVSSPVPEDLWAHQDLLRQLASALGMQAELVQENTCKLVDNLQSSIPGRVPIPIMKCCWNLPRLCEPPYFFRTYGKAYEQVLCPYGKIQVFLFTSYP